MSKPFARLVVVLTAAFFAAFLVWPVAQILRGGFVDADGRLTFACVRALLADPTYRDALLRSLGLASAATALSMALGLPLAFVADRFRFPGKGILGRSSFFP